jgi:parallel beta-helix repeat protein
MLGEGWKITSIEDRTVLLGQGHYWTRLAGKSWDNYAFTSRFRIGTGTLHINYRLTEQEDGPHRYFVGISTDRLYLSKQVGGSIEDLAASPLRLDDTWHEIEVYGYGGKIQISVDEVPSLTYTDPQPILEGGVAFETLEDSRFYIDGMEIRSITVPEIWPETLVPLQTSEKVTEVPPSEGVTPPVRPPPESAPGIESPPLVEKVVQKGGTIIRDEIWSGEILVSDSIFIPTGVTVTILPGTVVKFQHYRGYREPSKRLGMEIQGALIAEGSPQNQIWFTSDAPDPINGDWRMLRFVHADDRSVLNYTIVEFALQGINLWNSSPLISHSIVRWCNWEGIYLESYCHPLIEYNQIYQNGYNGIAMEQFNDAVIRYNTISSSGTNGIHIDASRAVVEENIVQYNHAHGLSVDDHATLIATGNTLQYNGGSGIGIGEGANQVTATGNLFAYNQQAIGPHGPEAVVVNTPGGGAGAFIYDYPDPRPHDLGYTPGDPSKDRYLYVYPDSDETRRVVQKIGNGLGLTWSLAWDGSSIWTAALNGNVYQLDPSTGAVLTQWKFPGVQPWGMTFDGTNLWINDFAEKKVYQMDRQGHLISTFIIPDTVGGAKGLTWDGKNLYLMGWTSPVIYELNKQGQELGRINIQGGYAGGGLTWDGQYFWAPGGRGISRISRDGEIVGGIYAASEGTWDLCWDGTYLWASQRTNENWLDSKIFKIEVLSTN